MNSFNYFSLTLSSSSSYFWSHLLKCFFLLLPPLSLSPSLARILRVLFNKFLCSLSLSHSLSMLHHHLPPYCRAYCLTSTSRDVKFKQRFVDLSLSLSFFFFLKQFVFIPYCLLTLIFLLFQCIAMCIDGK